MSSSRLCLFILLISQTVNAALKNIQYKSTQFSMNIPKHWEQLNDTFGVPITLLGPWDNETQLRHVLMITPDELSNAFTLNKQALKEQFVDYKKGRSQWAKQQNAQIISFSNLKFPSIGQESMEFGFTFKQQGITYLEKSLYVFCGPKQVFHLKSLEVRFSQEQAAKDMYNMINSFQCPKQIK